MRENKFRAWDKEARIMIHAFWVGSINSKAYSIGSRNELIQKDFEIMQYTGLKDKKGKEIYEGDIVIMQNYGIDGIRATIFWNERECGWHYLPMATLSSSDRLLGPVTDVNGKKHTGHTIAVIGNIYENPELVT